jgi:hypothetical protein
MDKQTVELVYLGRAPGVGAKWVDRFARVEAFEKLDGDDKRKLVTLAYKADKRSRVIGGVYQVQAEVSADGDVTSIWLGSLSFVRRLEHPLVALFEAEHYAHEVRGKVEAREKQMLANPKLQLDIANLRNVYARLGWGDKTVFETVLLGLLRRP